LFIAHLESQDSLALLILLNNTIFTISHL